MCVATLTVAFSPASFKFTARRSAGRAGCRQHQRVFEPHDVSRAVCIDDRDSDETGRALLHLDLLRTANQAARAIERDVKEVIFRVVSDADERTHSATI